jgi:CDP-4-dehydro-6-deoxyglucose reductase, E3
MNSPTPSPAARVRIQPAGIEFAVPAGKTILEAAIDEQLGIPYSCRNGSCGTCLGTLQSGHIRHEPAEPVALRGAGKDAVLACCAYPVSETIVITNERAQPFPVPPVARTAVRVTGLDLAAPDVMVIRLATPAGRPLRYIAGQYLELSLKDVAPRKYSMANAPGGETLELHVRRTPGGQFTRHVFESMKVGDLLRASGPYGSFTLQAHSRKPLIFVASGTGFAPVKALIEHIEGASCGRSAVVYWGGRRPKDLYLDRWLRGKATELAWLTYVPVISDNVAAHEWSGRRGLVHRAVLEDFSDLSTHQVYACGAPIVVDSARSEYRALARMNQADFFADSFVTSPPV